MYHCLAFEFALIFEKYIFLINNAPIRCNFVSIKNLKQMNMYLPKFVLDIFKIHSITKLQGQII